MQRPAAFGIFAAPLLLPRQDIIQKFHRRDKIFRIRIISIKIAHFVPALLVGWHMIFRNIDSARISWIARLGNDFLE